MIDYMNRQSLCYSERDASVQRGHPNPAIGRHKIINLQTTALQTHPACAILHHLQECIQN